MGNTQFRGLGDVYKRQDGQYLVEFIETLSGRTISTARSGSKQGSLTIKIPAFTGDIAFKLTRSDA